MTCEMDNVSVRKILDSRCGFTVEVLVKGKDGNMALTRVPNSTSTGEHEVCAYPKDGIDAGIGRFNRVKERLSGYDAEDQAGIDSALKSIGGKRFEEIGGNIATGVSVSSAKLAARSRGMELYDYVNSVLMKGSGIEAGIPRPIGNLIGGGAHAHSNMSIQEILVSPKGESFMSNAYANGQAHKKLGEELGRRGGAYGVNVEGAWNTGLSDMENVKLARGIADAIRDELGIEVDLGIDFAASEYHEGGRYAYSGRKINREEQIDFVNKLAQEFGIRYIEDPMEENDFEGFAKINGVLGGSALVVGDDIYTTDPERLREGIRNRSSNAVLIKVNQIGTLSDTIEVVKLANKNKMSTVVSHRSRDTYDSFIAHLAVAFGSEYIKCGIVGGERVSKLNEVARIEELRR